MARRRLPRLPSREVQALVPRPGYYLLPPDDGRWNEVALLVFVLGRHRIAARLLPRPRGQPPKLDRMQAAAQWLNREGIAFVSDAPGSRCVKSLLRFLTEWRDAERAAGIPRGKETNSTSAELAGTLIAVFRNMDWRIIPPPAYDA